MKRIIYLIVILMVVALLPLTAQAAPVGTLTYIEGRVDITRTGQAAQLANLGDEVYQGDILRSKSKSKAEITFIDGSILRLAENTRMKITEYEAQTHRNRGILNLFRGKIQSIVKAGLGRLFGHKRPNRYEVHTPTAVVGVRGTNFFTYYINGKSGAAFKEGQGYVFSTNVPEKVVDINAGQAMLVVSPNVPPVIAPATDVEIQKHIQDTAPTEEVSEEGGEEEPTEEAVTEEAPGEQAEGTVDEEPAEEETVVQEEAPSEQEVDATSVTEDAVATEPVTTEIATEPTSPVTTDDTTSPPISESHPEVLVPGIELLITTSNFDGTFTGYLFEAGTTGDINLSGTYTPGGTTTLDPFNGTSSSGSAFNGYLGGVQGSWAGLINSLWVGGGVGFLTGGLGGTYNSETGALSATGIGSLSGSLGATTLTPDEFLSTGLSSTPFNSLGVKDTVSLISVPNVSLTPPTPTIGGLETASGRLLGIFAETASGTYNNPNSDPLGTFVFGVVDPAYAAIGNLTASDDGSAHIRVSNAAGQTLVYMDNTYMGDIWLSQRGTYASNAGGAYDSLTAGRMVLDPLAYTGEWGSPMTSLYSNNGGTFLSVASDTGRIGGLAAPWDNDLTSLRVIGLHDFTADGRVLMNTPIIGWDPNDPNSGFAGVTAGWWEIATGETWGDIQAEAVALYMDALGNAGWLTSSNISGVFYNGQPLWTASGTWNRTFKQAVSNPAAYMIYQGLMSGSLSGNFNGAGQILGALYGGYTKLFYDGTSSLPWGIYDLKFGNSSEPNHYQDRSGTSWQAYVGGMGEFDALSINSEPGYWMAKASGTWTDDGKISGQLGGLGNPQLSRYMTHSSMGTLGGPFQGTADTSTWIGQSIGRFEGDPLAYSGTWSDYGTGGLLANYGGFPSLDVVVYGPLGGLAAPWGNATADLTGMGEFYPYSGPVEGRLLWNTDPDGWDPNDTTSFGLHYWEPYHLYGGFAAFTAGWWELAAGAPFGTIDAESVALYMDAAGNAGWLTSNDIKGSFYPNPDYYYGMWMVDGAWNRTFKQTVANPAEYEVGGGDLYAWLHGDFNGSGNIFGRNDDYYSTVEFFSLLTGGMSLPWGIYDLKLGNYLEPNSYEGRSGTSWQAYVGGRGYFDAQSIELLMPGYWIAKVSGTWADDGKISGQLGGLGNAQASRYVTLATMGTLGGPFQGTADTSTWIGQSIGRFEGDPVSFSSSLYGPIYRMVEGTMVEGDYGYWYWGEPWVEKYYDYRYFAAASDSTIYYGEKFDELHDQSSDFEQGYVYLPGGVPNDITIPPEGQKIFVDDMDELLFSDGGPWSVGSLTPADFMTPPGPEFGPVWYEERASNALVQSNYGFDGIFAGTDDLWSATAAAPAGVELLGGMFDPVYPDDLLLIFDPITGTAPPLFATELASSDYTLGAYSGFLGGVINHVQGNAYAVYIDPAQNSGVLESHFAGPSPVGYVFQASGTIYPHQMETGIGIDPANLATFLDHGLIVGWLGGDFGSYENYLWSELGWGGTQSIQGHDDWGVFQLLFGIQNVANNPASTGSATAKVGGYAQFGTHEASSGWIPDIGVYLTGPMTISLTDGIFVTPFAGDFITLTKYGQLAGEAVGTHDSASSIGTWQAQASGYWSGGQPVLFNMTVDGDQYRADKEIYGWWENTSTGANYYYSYFTGVNAGWSSENSATGIITHMDYNPDGSTETWTYDPGTDTFTYSEGTYSGSILDNLRNGPEGDVPPDPMPYVSLDPSGWLEALGAGLTNLWDATPTAAAQVRFIGEFDRHWEEINYPTVFSAEIGSYNPYDDTDTILNPADNSQNGAYHGYMVGNTSGSSLTGTIGAVAADSSGNLYILAGGSTGTLDLASTLWSGSGSVFPVQVVSGPVQKISGGDIMPVDLDPEGPGALSLRSFSIWYDPDYPDPNYGSSGAFDHWSGGSYTTSAGIQPFTAWVDSATVAFERGSGTLDFGAVGVTSLLMGGTYQDPTDHWHIAFNGQSYEDPLFHHGILFSSPLAPVTEGQWSGGVVKGMGFDAWVSWDAAMTGVAGGKLAGTFNPNNHTFQVAALMNSMDTKTFLALAADAAGQERLKQLNLPCINIGQADLSGTNANGLAVLMENTTFFTYPDGTYARMWATDAVSGAYTTAPGIGEVVNLTGSNYTNAAGLTAQFEVANWNNLVPGGWGAHINGSGTVNNVNHTFIGAAAGLISPTGNVFGGTASGRAFPPSSN